MLADCLSLAKICERFNLTEQLKQHIISKSKKRTYFEKDADVYLVVGRYMFEDTKARAACWRYTATIREAAKRQIDSGDLAQWLNDNGGINALFRERPKVQRSNKTRTLHLRSSVEVEIDKPFTITLKSDGTGFFEVLNQKELEK